MSFKRGLYSGFPIALGYLSVSFAFGVLAVSKGFPVWFPILVSVTNLTGTGQFAGVDLIASGAMVVEIFMTIFVISIRYSLMSLSLSQKLGEEFTLGRRFLIAFAVTDEIYAVAIRQKQPLTFKFFMGLILSSYVGWVLGTTLGAVLGNVFPPSLMNAFGIALYAMFIAIIIPDARGNSAIFKVILISVAISCLFFFVPVINKLSSGWVIIICAVVSSALGAWLFPVTQKEDAENEAV